MKVLPETFVDDAERLARFQREAEVLASLNHPNIAQIYGLESHQPERSAARSDVAERDVVGVGPHDTDQSQRAFPYLVLELVEGPTLADRIAEGVIPVDEALAIAKQVAEALEAAHEQGVIHRDLKPANIKVTPDGVVKVLDFGLAKALESERGGDASESPTVATAVTGMGMILGTAAYMSPEQARGKQVDKRADIWAFAVVVYEMLTARRAFEAEDVSLTLAEVMKSEPDWTALPSDISPVVRTYLARCLRKDPKERVRDIGDVRLAIEGAFETGLVRAGAEVASSTPRAVRALIVALAAAIVGLVAWIATRGSASTPRVSRTSIVLPQSQSPSGTGRRGIAISPDGSRIVYVANRQLYLRAVDELEAEALAGTEGANPTSPVFSPDGQWIAYYSNTTGVLHKIAVTGGAPATLVDTSNPYGVSWSTDDTIVFGQFNNIKRVDAASGDQETLVAVENESVRGPQVLPGGRSLLFTVAPGDWDDASIVVQSLDTGERRVLVEGGTDARYLASGHLVYAVGGNLFAIAFDVDRLETVGGPVPLVENVRYASVTGGVHFDVSRDGTLVYIPGPGERAGRVLVWVDRDGRQEPIATEPREFVAARVSPDGTKAVLDARGGDNDVWVWDFARESMTRLTFDPGRDEAPMWTPDGGSVIYASQGVGPSLNLHRRAADGTGRAERLFESRHHQVPYTMTPDGKKIVYLDIAPGAQGTDLGVLTLDGTPVAEPILDSDFTLSNAHLSPDGRWLAYHSNESGTNEVYVRPFPDVDSGRWQISSAGGREALWGPDGRELFYRLDQDLMRVTVETEPVLRAGNPERILDGRENFFSGLRRSFDISPDGTRFLMLKEHAQIREVDPYAGLTRIIVVQNWFEELNARVPVE